MDRLTERDEYGNADIIALSDVMPELYAELSFSETNALTDTLNRLAAYEDTGFTPADVVAMKTEYSDTFQAHLNELLDIKDKRIAELEAENARLHKLVDNIECVTRGEEK